MPTDDLYDDLSIGFLGALWGEGYLSPGGPEEVSRVLSGVDLAGKNVLDIGCGSGAISIELIQSHDAGHVTAIDVEDPVCNAARTFAEAAGLAERMTITKVTPGPFPYHAAMFDVVFSKDSIIHIPDKEALAAEVFRVLKPGGMFAASDWLMAHDGPPSQDMQTYIEAEALDFAMASPARYDAAMRDAGFVDIELVNRNQWYARVAADELAQLSGPERTSWETRYGADFIAAQINTWTAMQQVLQSGEHCPHHIRARKPE